MTMNSEELWNSQMTDFGFDPYERRIIVINLIEGGYGSVEKFMRPIFDNDFDRNTETLFECFVKEDFFAKNCDMKTFFEKWFKYGRHRRGESDDSEINVCLELATRVHNNAKSWQKQLNLHQQRDSQKWLKLYNYIKDEFKTDWDSNVRGYMIQPDIIIEWLKTNKHKIINANQPGQLVMHNPYIISDA